MKKKIILMAGYLMVSSSAFASGDHDHGHDMSGHQVKQHAKHEGMLHQGMNDKRMDMSSHQMFLKKTEVDGYTATFHVMPAATGMQHGGSHNLMVKIEKDGKEVSDVMINSKVFFPNKTTDSKMLMKMNGWFVNGYDLGEGKHGIMILFKTADGKKHKTSVYYPEEK